MRNVIGHCSGTISRGGCGVYYDCDLLDEYGRELSFIFTPPRSGKIHVKYARYQYNYSVEVTWPGHEMNPAEYREWVDIVMNLADKCFREIRDMQFAELVPRD